jgi:hypothetical protein
LLRLAVENKAKLATLDAAIRGANSDEASALWLISAELSNQ